MRPLKTRPLWVLLSVYLTLVIVASFEKHNTRLPKHFSLFSVVQFNNEECTTDATPVGGSTAGTCYTSTECTDKGGIKAGNCASGFGTCCAFINTAEANAQIMENRTRLRNGEYPANDVATANLAIAYTINKMQSDICQIRLDFTTFVIAGPADSNENIGTAMPQTTSTNCVDTLTIVTTAIPNSSDDGGFGSLCGALTGEHLYIELSPTATDTATLNIATNVAAPATAANANRVWDIKVSQIECYAMYRAPQGCHRYLMADTGTITSMNFQVLANQLANQNTGLELPSQRLKTCIRRSKGRCCVQYQLCTSHGGIVLADTETTSGNANTGSGQGLIGQNPLLASTVWINPAWSIDTNTFPFAMDTGGNVIVVTIAVPAGGDVIFAAQTNIGMVDSMCSDDYVEIPSSWSGACGSTHGSSRNTINTRYCGARFGANFPSAIALTASTPVCDCSEPFVVRHNSDTANDLGGTSSAAGAAAPTGVANTVTGAASANAAINANQVGTAVGRGFCLDYKQISCWN